MTTSALILIVFAITATLACLLKIYVLLEGARLRRLEHFATAFHENARAMLADDRTLPEAVLRDLEFWNAVIASKPLALRAAFVIAGRSVRNRRRAGGPVHLKDDEGHSFFGENPDLEQKYFSTALDGIIASCFRHPVIGLFLEEGVSKYLRGLQESRNLREAELISSAVMKRVHVPHHRGGMAAAA
jgi:hypothetical protein